MRRLLKQVIWLVYPDYFMNKHFRNHSRPGVEEEIIRFFLSHNTTAIDVGAFCTKRVRDLESPDDQKIT